jgi:hypothetical protein
LSFAGLPVFMVNSMRFSLFGCLVSIAEDYGAFATGASKTLPIHIRRGLPPGLVPVSTLAR